MAHAYTPGLKISHREVIRRSRTLPIKGKVLVNKGDALEAQQVVAETFMPGDIIPVNLSNLLSMPPADVPECMLVKEGDQISLGDIIARTQGIFGMFKSEYKSKYEGTVETISNVTGQMILRGEPHPVRVLAFLPGKVVEVLPDEGVVIEAEVSYIQGIFGIGGETFGKIKMACGSHSEELTKDKITADMQGSVIVGGSRVTADAIAKAVEIGAAGIVTGGIDDADLRDFLGYDLGVAITGTEKKGITLITTEGFGDIAMAQRTFNLLKSREGANASINGATQIRAGVIRPIIAIPVDDSVPKAHQSEGHVEGVLEIGSSLRIIRYPYFGMIGKVKDLPSEPQALESGSKARVLDVELTSGEIVTVPRANVELIEGDS